MHHRWRPGGSGAHTKCAGACTARPAQPGHLAIGPSAVQACMTDAVQHMGHGHRLNCMGFRATAITVADKCCLMQHGVLLALPWAVWTCPETSGRVVAGQGAVLQQECPAAIQTLAWQMRVGRRSSSGATCQPREQCQHHRCCAHRSWLAG
jgi:hypothetical protein